MNGAHLKRLLERAGDERRAGAEMRAWPVIQEAFARRDTEKVRRRMPRPLARIAPRRPVARPAAVFAGIAALAAIVALVATSPGAAVADWVRDHIVGKPGVEKSAPALTHLPGGGRMLVSSRQGVWVVQANGSRRLLRGYDDATWSPRGLYIGASRGHELFAVEPGGRVHWSLARAGQVHGVDWSPDGFRVAYLSGRSLRVVAGDGTGDEQLRRRVADVAPVWRPRAPHMLALASRPRTIDLVATDAGALAWRHALPHSARSLAWSADGRMLAVAGRRQVTILDGATGRAQHRIAAPRGFGITAVAFANHGRQLAVALGSRDGRARALVVDLDARHPKPRRLFAGTGRFAQVQWSPDDHWVLISWPAANQWLFLRSARVSGVSAVRDIARQFDPGARSARFPAIADWCCGSR